MTFATTVAVATPPISRNPDKKRQSRRTMNSLSLSPNLTRRFLFSFFFSSRHFRPFSASSPIRVPNSSPPSIIRAGVRTGARTDTEAREKLKDEWLASLSCPLTPPRGFAGDGDQKELLDSDSSLVIGVDPDTHGAVALLRGNASDCSAEVFDSPKLSVLIGGRVRKRLDTKSMIELLRSFDAPVGTIAYIEQSMPFPKDGKQGWWCGGFGYGLWIGMLVALGFSVVPVSSASWKKKFELYGSSYTKDDSRKVASTLFPSLSSALGRKKDHGRAEALLIAAYGHGLKMELDTTLALDELIS